MSIEMHELFATRIYKFKNPNAETDNKAWLDLILDIKKRDDGYTASNVNGWHSSSIHREPGLQSLGRFINECLQSVARQEKWVAPARFQIEGWANVNRYAAFNKVHNHGGSHLSGCYYVAVPPKSGGIVFRDPREVCHMMILPYVNQNDRNLFFKVAPQPGDLLVFPSWLLHEVEPNMTHEERVSVAFNARVEGGV